LHAEFLGRRLEKCDDMVVTQGVEEGIFAVGRLAVGGLAVAVAKRRGDGGEEPQEDVAEGLLVVGAEEFAGDDEGLGGDLEEVVAQGPAEVGHVDVAVNAGEHLQVVGRAVDVVQLRGGGPGESVGAGHGAAGEVPVAEGGQVGWRLERVHGGCPGRCARETLAGGEGARALGAPGRPGGRLSLFTLADQGKQGQ
jgi:hypothetical protein